ncbi:MAG TPA: PEP/pyruvate-binding domain-containing protein [Pyrinomonadaceae bacterium]|nr:PEP/pyruvate-binding domain-containing protein [Pyrinomonadaceae bacterium]
MRITPFKMLVVLSIFASAASAQMARKPSPTREPADHKAVPQTNKNSLPKITSRADFDSIARTYHQGTPYALPHVMFVIDRRAGNKIYFLNSQKYRFHKDFLLATYMIPRGTDIFKPVYVDADRRFIVGTIAFQKTIDKFTWELWEGDLATGAMIRQANDVINKSFYEKVWFKPNSLRQDDASEQLGISRVSQDEINRNEAYLALNTGTAVGRLHIIDKFDDTVEIGDNEILVIKELPLTLPQVRGIILAEPSSPLSHVNILARGWNIPNVYIKDADKLFKEYDTRVFKLTANLTDYSFEPASLDDIKTGFVSPDQQVPPADLGVTDLKPIGKMTAKDSIAYGSKAANLGQLIAKRVPGITVPDGFGIPYSAYKQFMADNGLDAVINKLMDDNDFVHNPRVRRQRLEGFRKQVQNGKFDPELRAKILYRWKVQLASKPVFVRSSSNSEDLPNFSGAGLYSSVPNVREEDKLIEAVKTVWASLWTFQGYEARVRNYVSQSDVYMSALVQVGVDMEKGGVMITKDPFDDKNKNAVYISAVCGHNTKVTANDGVPEQVLYNPKSNSVVVMTLSQQKGALRFDENGDLKETTDVCAATKSKRVLTDLQSRALARAAIAIRTAFGNKKEQDIEWGLIGNRIYIVQSRPYIDRK